MIRRGLRTFVVVLLALLPGPVRAQLLSPGKLAADHAALEGVRSCTSCHELGARGSSAARCLECHEPIAKRVAARRGYHATISKQPCGDCHKEHLGRDFELVRLDTARFDHARTGFALEGEHARATCSECHAPERVQAQDVRAWLARTGSRRTLLGLPVTCRGCHRADDPHGRQFGARECADCHDAASWEEAPGFRHDEADFRLTGAHRDVSCERCHAPPPGRPSAERRYAGVAHASCTSCHRDEHRGRMGATCTDCHNTGSWHDLAASPALARRFDHDRTRFPLHGAHDDVECARCHSARPVSTPALRIRPAAGTERFAYPRPEGRSCQSCHVDYHRGELGATSCSSCHAQSAWAPPTFDIARHERTRFPLSGAHGVTPCAACHLKASPATPPTFRLGDRSCARCHAAKSPHEDLPLYRACESCHTTASFAVAEFDHAKTAGAACSSCHGKQDPHSEQFAGRPCSECHETASFRIAAFDHGRTRYALTGAHASAACSACHRSEPAGDGRSMVRYKPLGMTCLDCHGDDR